LWLNGDHYKWRVMRTLGVEEKYITGDASDYEKFEAWAKSVPYCIGNPLFHWTHLELKRYFHMDMILNEKTCKVIWNHCNEILQHDDFSVRGIISKSNVEMIGTTDDPLDSLEYHKAIQQNEDIKIKVMPTFRPDSILEINHSSFLEYIGKLEKITNSKITNYEQLLEAIKNRVNYFHEIGCRISDHGLEYMPYAESDWNEISAIFRKRKDGFIVTKEEEDKYKTFTLHFLGQLYHSLGWIMQLHIGSIRNANTRKLQQLGANAGYDSINDFILAKPLNSFLNALERENKLPKMILYTLNPVYNYVIASTAGNFQGEGIKGKIQFGAAWWFNDHKDGILSHMKDLANVGVLSSFIGMLTDSRSFLSYVRHEYFRRILCNLIGTWVENGEAPSDYSFLGKVIQDICYFNAKNYFNIQ
jgi:glucuronate isomerase